ncbi:twin-arginine translocase TatA/TatE family subunit [Streptomyces spinoverrucosus]|uniref:twin-arginine translocase TatA/TatE family subunit n=1 Tax=Streptomyces spinoverrucosus TaxID=284043 RepID=UPI0018C4014D|nr:twin-arginine translocase TatA/TatE family subunit [Streptomyces spinoverrucosus]MBG0850532.1 twin-arginine translocase TatA/TatE family subunit [Streptomyces spinoverrucosus]
MFGLSELAVVLIVVIAVLAAKKLPELARSAGKSARILKAEAGAMKEPRTPAGEQAAPRVIQGETITRTGRDSAQPHSDEQPRPRG